MKIELKSLKIARHLSEETTAFSAKIEVDGKVVGDVRNDGRGGCHMIHLDPSVRDAVEAEAKRRFPDEKYEALDRVVDDLIEAEEDRKEAISLVKKGFPYVVKVYADKKVIEGVAGRLEYHDRVLVIGYKDPSQLDGILKKEKADKHVVLTQP